jgi:hypothetical protein
MIECLKFMKKCLAARRVTKDSESLDAIAGDKVECAREVEV